MLRIPVFAASAASAAELPPPMPSDARLLRLRLDQVEADLRRLSIERDHLRAALAALTRPAAGVSPLRRALASVEDPDHELDDPAFLSAAASLAGKRG